MWKARLKSPDPLENCRFYAVRVPYSVFSRETLTTRGNIPVKGFYRGKCVAV